MGKRLTVLIVEVAVVDPCLQHFQVRDARLLSQEPHGTDTSTKTTDTQHRHKTDKKTRTCAQHTDEQAYRHTKGASIVQGQSQETRPHDQNAPDN